MRRGPVGGDVGATVGATVAGVDVAGADVAGAEVLLGTGGDVTTTGGDVAITGGDVAVTGGFVGHVDPTSPELHAHIPLLHVDVYVAVEAQSKFKGMNAGAGNGY